jgi:hypothetical protein
MNLAYVKYEKPMRERYQARGLTVTGRVRVNRRHPKLDGLSRKEYHRQHMDWWRHRSRMKSCVIVALRYIASSPAPEHGGFHLEAVRTARRAIREIQRLRRKLKRLNSH